MPVSLFLVGLAGSLVHCVGMCGPFVLGQVMSDAMRTSMAGAAQTQVPAAAQPQQPAAEAPEVRLAKLKGMLDQGLITQDDYDQAKAEILKQLIG